MTAICDSVINLCAIRATRLDAVGNPTAGPNNSYVSNKPIAIAVTPVVQEGEDKTQTSGCDCIVGSYKGPDKLKRFGLSLELAKLEPGLLEMLIGASAILNGSSDPIGLWWPTQLSCDDAQQPNVALEAWQYLWEDDHQAADYPYVHWIWPSTRWQIAPHALNSDFLQPSVNGFTRGNPNWGLGIYDAQPEAAEEQGGFFFTDTIPTAACGYQSQGIT